MPSRRGGLRAAKQHLLSQCREAALLFTELEEEWLCTSSRGLLLCRHLYTLMSRVQKLRNGAPQLGC